MSSIDPKVLAAVEEFSKTVGELDPRVRDLLAQVRAGRDDTEVMADLIRLTQADPELLAKIEAAAAVSFQPLKEESELDVQESVQALQSLHDRQKLLKDLNFKEEDLVFHPEGTAFPQLHPVMMAVILERLQFDDDIPELRTGDLPLEAMPSVPVANAARNPVALGLQLETAAREVKDELNVAHMARSDQLTIIGQEIPVKDEQGTLMVRKAKSEFVAVSEGRVGVEGYKAGHKPALRPVEDLSVAAVLAALSEDLRKRYAHKALTSIQGRRSAVPVIGALIQRELAEKGIQVTLDGVEALLETPVAEAEWSTFIELDNSSMQSRFSFIDTAAKVLAIGLHQQLGDVTHILLHIEPINEVSRRRVGWGAKAVAAQ